MNTKVQIEKLNRDNYFIWSTQISLVLESKGLWNHVTGRARMPEEGNAEQIIKFHAQERLAIAEIMLNIGPIKFAAVANLQTLREVWNSLRNTHRSQCMAQQSELRRKLLYLKKEDSESIEEFVNKICDIENRLALSGYSLNTEDKRFALLEGLPEEYEMLKTVLEGQELQDFEAIVARLLIREDQLKRKGEKNGNNVAQSAAFVATDRKRRFNKNIVCHYCNKKGHPSFKCFKNPESKFFKGNRRHNENAGRQRFANGSLENSHIAFMAQETVPGEKNNWYLDSCASVHMCNGKCYFRNFVVVDDSRKIETASKNENLNIEGTGNIMMKTKVNGETIHFELKDVAFVPNLRANLIAVSKMQAAGLRVDFPANATLCQVFKEKTLFLKGTSEGTNIFKITDVEVSRNSKSEKVNIAENGRGISLDLMHHRMGHTGV